MTLTVSTQVNPIGSTLIQDTDSDATAENNVTGTTGSFYMVDIDNSANGTAVYLKIWDHAAPTVGTTAADWVFRCAGSTRRQVVIPEGHAYTVGLSFATVTGAAEANTTSPVSNVTVRIVAT